MVRNYSSSDTHRRIAKVAARQHGVFTRRQAIEAGLTSSQVRYRVGSEQWIAVDHGVYRLAGTPTSWKQQLTAACLVGPAVASHRSAGLLWEFPAMRREIVEVTAMRHLRRHGRDIVWHESYHLSDRDVTEVDGIPVTRPTRTFLDLAVVLDAGPLEEVLDDGLHRHLLSIPAIWQRWELLGPLRHGARKVKALLEHHTSEVRPAESVLETLFRQLVRDAGLPIPVAQFEVPEVARIDFAYPDLMIAIELDGARYHSTARAVESDRVRENQLVALGWRVLRFTWADVTERCESTIETMRISCATIRPQIRIEEGA